MKSKTILVLSLVLNAVLLSTVGYIHSLNVEPYKTPAFIHYIVTNAPSGMVDHKLHPVSAPAETVAVNGNRKDSSRRLSTPDAARPGLGRHFGSNGHHRSMKPAKHKLNISKRGRPLRVGFLPVSDCAPLVIGHEFGLYEKYGVKVELQREVSWKSIHDKIVAEFWMRRTRLARCRS
jgi:hypothetical protein